jgi:hypothetical protein
VLLYSKYKIFEEGINQLAVVSFEIHIAVTRKSVCVMRVHERERERAFSVSKIHHLKNFLKHFVKQSSVYLPWPLRMLFWC